MDGFWHKAWQFALLFAVISMMAATIAVNGGALHDADVREIIAEEGAVAAGNAGAAARDASILPDLTPIADLQSAPTGEVHVVFAPDAADPIEREYQAKYEIRLEVIEGVCTIDKGDPDNPDDDVKVNMWGYRIEGSDEVICGTPGPILRGRVGDYVTVTLTAEPDNAHPHNIDFHAVTGQGGGAADLTVAPGETASISVRLLYPGAFMYHCAYGDVPVHMSQGMYGMWIVDPEIPLPDVDAEYAIVQSEWYLSDRPNAEGLYETNKLKLTNEEPTYVVFNGTTFALVENPIEIETGDRVRFYFVNAGLNLDSNFHPIGSHWDTVYPEAATHPVNPVIRGSQTTLVPAGGGTVTELIGQVPSTIILVDHALSRTFYKGAIGLVVVDGAENPEIFKVTNPAGGAADDHDHGDHEEGVTEGETVEVAITKDGWVDPSDADDAFSPNVITVEVGDTVTWTNNDGTMHTVTSGTSDGAKTNADGTFDSGFLNTGDTFSYTFTEEGEYEYFCMPHPWMRGKVIVVPKK